MSQLIDCPAHEGNYDCNSFCAICEGEQVYDPNGELGWLAREQMNNIGTVSSTKAL